MSETQAVLEQEQKEGCATTVPSWVAELTLSQRRDIKACLPFLFKALDASQFCGTAWAWHSESANMTVMVACGEEKHTLVIMVFDGDVSEEIELWTTKLRLTGQWKRRLRQLSGEAMVLSQTRPRCPKCGAKLLIVRRREDSVQFFGCSKFRSSSKCHGSLNIIDHDVEH